MHLAVALDGAGWHPAAWREPVIFQAGDSDEGREFAASSADAIFSRHGTLDAGQAFYQDVKGRLARYGRTRRAPPCASTWASGNENS